MASLQQINKQAIGFVERKSRKKFEMKPTIRYGRDCKNLLRDKGAGTAITRASVIINRKLSKPKYCKLLKPVIVHELRENLGFQHYENKQTAHRAARKLELQVMGKDKKELEKLAREAGYYG